jgi:hypothetical protein
MSDKRTIAVDYAPRRSRRKRRIALLLLATCTLGLLAAGYGLVKPKWPDWQWRYYVYRSLHYQGAPDKPASGQPDFWLRMNPYAAGYGDYVFLHERTSPSGIHRLVLVNALSSSETQQDPNEPDRRSGQFLDLEFWAYDPANAYKYKHRPLGHTYQGDPQREWTMGLAYKFQVLNGQPDPKDESHFWFIYVLDGERGTVDGWLRDDGSVVCKIRDGPALQWQPDGGK